MTVYTCQRELYNLSVELELSCFRPYQRPMNNSTILFCYPVLIPVVKRKPILLVDDSDDSTKAVDVFQRSGIEYVEYQEV